eukprot:997488-Amorphochlora_amoeboformis.AAC.1
MIDSPILYGRYSLPLNTHGTVSPCGITESDIERSPENPWNTFSRYSRRIPLVTVSDGHSPQATSDGGQTAWRAR